MISAGPYLACDTHRDCGCFIHDIAAPIFLCVGLLYLSGNSVTEALNVRYTYRGEESFQC